MPHCSHARNRSALAQGRIPFVLEADLQRQEARRETADVEGSSRIDFPGRRCQQSADGVPRAESPNTVPPRMSMVAIMVLGSLSFLDLQFRRLQVIRRL